MHLSKQDVKAPRISAAAKLTLWEVGVTVSDKGFTKDGKLGHKLGLGTQLFQEQT